MVEKNSSDNKIKIAEVKKILAAEPAQEELRTLAADARGSVQKLLAAYYKREARAQAERERFEAMRAYEKKYFEQDYRYIAGVDEAGRGPLAGPLVIAAVILPREIFIAGLNDSKKLAAAKREKLYAEILTQALAVSVNIVSVSNIDHDNIYAATRKGMETVLRHLKIRPDVALVDAMPLALENIACEPIIHGDALSISIAAASIIAKVTRDRIMLRLAEKFPAYGFEHNKGYGSSEHMEAIRKFGATSWHRRSYEPVKSLALPPVPERGNILYDPGESEGDREYELEF